MVTGVLQFVPLVLALFLERRKRSSERMQLLRGGSTREDTIIQPSET